jgi:hypothetical protein
VERIKNSLQANDHEHEADFARALSDAKALVAALERLSSAPG